MTALDGTDVEILRLLSEDGRMAYSEIGERVGLSGPAVSSRVEKMEDAGVVRGFTVEVEPSTLRTGVAVLVRVEPRTVDVEGVRERAVESDGVEHVFVTADGDVWLFGRAPASDVRGWVAGVVGDSDAEVSIRLVDAHDWTPSLEGFDIALPCVECGNTVDSEGESSRVDGEVYHFCCPSCRARFVERYRRLEEGA